MRTALTPTPSTRSSPMPPARPNCPGARCSRPISPPIIPMRVFPTPSARGHATSPDRLPGVSKWAFSYGAEYNIPVTLLDKDGQLYLGVDGNYRSHWNSNASPSIYTEVKGYALTNFRAGFRGEGFDIFGRSEEHTSELQSLMRISYAVFCLKKKK